MGFVFVCCCVFIVLEAVTTATEDNQTFADQDLDVIERKPELIPGEQLLNNFQDPEYNNTVQPGPESGLPTVLDIIKGWTYQDGDSGEEEGRELSSNETESVSRKKRHLNFICKLGLCSGKEDGSGLHGSSRLSLSIGLPLLTVNSGDGEGVRRYTGCRNCGYGPQQVAPVPLQVPASAPVLAPSHNPCGGGGCDHQPTEWYSPCAHGLCSHQQPNKPHRCEGRACNIPSLPKPNPCEQGDCIFQPPPKHKEFYNPCADGSCTYEHLPQMKNPCGEGGCIYQPLSDIKPAYNPCPHGECVYQSKPTCEDGRCIYQHVTKIIESGNHCGEGGCIYQPLSEIKPAYKPCAGGDCVYEHEQPPHDPCGNGGCSYQPLSQIKPAYNPCTDGSCITQKVVAPCVSGSCVSVPVKEAISKVTNHPSF